MRTRPAAVLLAAVLSLSLVVSPAAAAGASATAQEREPRACFPGDGYAFTVGDGPARVDLIVHLSLFTSLGGPGTLGMEATGRIDDEEIVALRTGVVFAGVGEADGFLSNPFEPFAIAYEYRFRLPMFDGGGGPSVEYEETDAPVEGPVSEVDCR